MPAETQDRPASTGERDAIAGTIIRGSQAVGQQAHGMGDYWYKKDIAQSIGQMSEEAALAETMAKVGRQQRFMQQMEDRTQYLSDVIEMSAPEAVSKRAAGMRGYGKTAQRMATAGQAAGADPLATGRAIRRGAAPARRGRMRRATDLQRLDVGRRTEQYAGKMREYGKQERLADLVMSGFKGMMGARARETAAKTAKSHDWRKILMGWTVPG